MRGTRGLSLIETVIAFTVLLMFVLFVASLAPGSLLSIGRAHHEIVASNLAQSLLERKRSERYETLVPVVASPLAADVYQLDDGFVFTPEQSVYATASTRAMKVRITVRWKEQSGACSVFRESVIAKVNR